MNGREKVVIESQDVIRLVLQFLKENNLSDSMRQLQLESGVALNTVDSTEAFLSDVRYGRWDAVLLQVESLKLPAEKLVSACLLPAFASCWPSTALIVF